MMSEIDWDKPLEDEPGLREALKQFADPDAPQSTWQSLADRLEHQYDVDDIGIKALPVLVSIARRLSPRHRYRQLAWIGSIAFCSQLPGSRWVLESAPTAVQKVFTDALEQTVPLLTETLL